MTNMKAFWKKMQMSWNQKVAISEEVYEICMPTITVTRLFGLLPIKIYRNGNQIWYKPSLLYLIYSYAFGMITIYLTYEGFMRDVSSEKNKSIRVRTNSDVFVTFVDVTTVILVVFCGIFLTPFKFSTFRKFIQTLNDVDAIIPAVDVSSFKNKSILVMCTLLGTSFVVLTLDNLVYFNTAGAKSRKIFIFKSYTPLYVAYFIMIADQYLYWFFVRAVLRRTKGLNKHLEEDAFKKLLKRGFIEGSKESNTSRLENLNLFSLKKQSVLRNNNLKVNYSPIFKLMEAYIKITDAVKYLNCLFGITCAVTLIGILWHLIESPYWLIMELMGGRKNFEFISMMIAWCFIHFGRLVLLAHPCHACILEAQKTNNLVCRLLNVSDIKEQYRSQLADFSITLLHRKFEFNASGLTVIDLSLISSVTGAITTYLVILIQLATSVK